MSDNTPTRQGRLRAWMQRIGILGPAVLLVTAGFAVAYHFVQPAPPRHIVMATGSKDGAYYYYGRIYRELMAQEGIDVTLVETAGSIANVDLLNGGKADVAFVQGGARSDDGRTPLRSLASLYFEPIWVFVRRDAPIARLADLRGRRVAVDGEGSGTRVMALQLLADVGLDGAAVQISPQGGADAATALHEGGLDAAFFIIPANAPVVQSLFAAGDIRLLAIDRAAAYRVQHRFLSLLTLPEGAINLAADVPPADTVLLAPAANLVVRGDFHPALAELLLIEARKIHGYPGIFEEAHAFPSRNYLEYPMADAAQIFFELRPFAAEALFAVLGGESHRPAENHAAAADRLGLSLLQAGAADIRLADALAHQPLVPAAAVDRAQHRSGRHCRRAATAFRGARRDRAEGSAFEHTGRLWQSALHPAAAHHHVAGRAARRHRARRIAGGSIIKGGPKREVCPTRT